MGSRFDSRLQLAVAATMLLIASLRQRGDANLGVPREIMVGGKVGDVPVGWRLFFNYEGWANQISPVNRNNRLVFTFRERIPGIRQHSIWLLNKPGCDFTNGQILANVSVDKPVFRYTLDHFRQYNFACGDRSGYRCRRGGMSFTLQSSWNELPKRAPALHLLPALNYLTSL